MAMDRYVRGQQQMYETIERLALRHKTWTDHVTAMSSFIEATRFTLPTIDFDRVGGLIAAADLQRDAVARLTDRLLFQHADLIESLSQPGSLLVSVPLVVSDLPTMDVFVHTSAVRSITPHKPLEDQDEEHTVPLRRTIVTETEMFLEQTLPELKPSFLEQYRGVKARADGRGPDGWTQGSASMRKLLKGVLHSAAPNEAVLPWATKNNKEIDRHGRPTRPRRSSGFAASVRTTPTALTCGLNSSQPWLSLSSWTTPSTLMSSPSSRTSTTGSCCAPSLPCATY